jgi:hypothetical protein
VSAATEVLRQQREAPADKSTWTEGRNHFGWFLREVDVAGVPQWMWVLERRQLPEPGTYRPRRRYSRRRW